MAQQQIALDPSVLREFGENWNNDSIVEFFSMIKNLRDHNEVVFDDCGSISVWWETISELKQTSPSQEFRYHLKSFFDREKTYIKSRKLKLSAVSDLTKDLAEKTPDKIGIKIASELIDQVRFYSVKEFSLTDCKPYCRLFKYGKIIRVVPGIKFSPSDLIAPYIREAKKIEYFDRYLLKIVERHDDYDFLISNLGCCKKPSEIIVYAEPNPFNPLQKNFENELNAKYGSKIFKGIREYDSKKYNHDRFIIIDTNKVSIFFSTSFNNLRKVDEGIFQNKTAFRINFCKGRDYYD